MRWLTREQAFAETESVRNSLGPPQMLSFAIDPDELYRTIPIAPADTPDDEDFPGPVDRWYGRLDDRFFMLDIYRSHDNSPPESCNITTTSPAKDRFDWTTIRELNGLPSAVNLRHVAFIESREENPPHIVYRNDPRGFDDPVYNASSLADAESLIEFLHPFDGGWSYGIGTPDPDGNWQLWCHRDDERKLLGNYPFQASSVALACRLTENEYNSIRVVSGSSPDDREYTVQNGRVVKIAQRQNDC